MLWRHLLWGSLIYSFWNLSRQCPTLICHYVRVPSALVTFFHYFNVLISFLHSYHPGSLETRPLVPDVSSLFSCRLEAKIQPSGRLFWQIQISNQIIQFRLTKQREFVTICTRWLKKICLIIFTFRSRWTEGSTSISGSSVVKGACISSLSATGCLADGISYCKCCLVFLLKPGTSTNLR